MSLNFYLSCFILVLIVAAGCSSQRPEGKTEAEVLYKEAEEMVKDSRYIMAVEKLNQIKSQFPYSYYATPAELLQADILYQQENFVESAAAYILFRDFHPRHAKSSYVTWRIAESYFNQRPSTFDRDLTPAKEAIKYYLELQKKYPESEHFKESAERIKVCKDMIMQKQKYIADFYFKTEIYDSARFRYLDILKHFKDKDLRDHAMIRVVESSYHLKKKEDCSHYYKMYHREISDSARDSFDNIYKKCSGE